MMPEWHQLDSSITMSEQQESTKKKTLKSSSRSFWFSTGLTRYMNNIKSMPVIKAVKPSVTASKKVKNKKIIEAAAEHIILDIVQAKCCSTKKFIQTNYLYMYDENGLMNTPLKCGLCHYMKK